MQHTLLSVRPWAIPCIRLARGDFPVGGHSMEKAPYSSAFRIASYVILFLMAAAIVYSGAMAITHWSGIGV